MKMVATSLVFDACIETIWTSGIVLTSLLYDVNGNMTSRTDEAVISTLTYDNLNQLAQVANTGLSTEMYGYDDSGRRVRKTIGVNITNYLYNGDDILAEYASG